MSQYVVADLETIATDIPGAEGGWVYVISPSGEVSQFAKTPGRPLGIAIDKQGDLFVCDWDSHSVYKVTAL